MDAGACSVQRQLAHGDTHAINTKITKTKDTATVCYDSNLDIVRPVLDHGV
jgi:hypothetical protein